MEKKLEDYIHFYIGCKCHVYGAIIPDGKHPATPKEVTLNGVVTTAIDGTLWAHLDDDKWHHEVELSNLSILLRPITDITKDELRLIAKITAPTEDFSGRYLDDAFAQMQNLFIKQGINAFSFDELSSMQIFEVTALFLKQGFDLFGLIEAGVAIDKTK